MAFDDLLKRQLLLYTYNTRRISFKHIKLIIISITKAKLYVKAPIVTKNM